MSAPLLRRLAPAEVRPRRRAPVDAETLAAAATIVADVERDGASAVRSYAEKFGERAPGAPLLLGRDAMEAALARISADDRAVLERTAARIERFAEAQRAAVADVDVDVPGGRAGHTVEPVARAGCYAPAGRHPLPSSLLMTAVTARVAGCGTVIAATPNPGDVMLAAAAIAGADQVFAVGGAHAIAALAYGLDDEGLAPCDVIVGPGNRWVTAAKQLVFGVANVDMLAGPSELVVVADAAADAALVAADLLAQAEHDPDAVPALVATDAALIDAVDAELARQLETLDTADVARAALTNGFACLADSRDEALAIADALAPEHLELQVTDPAAAAAQIRRAGAVFVGPDAAEVIGDYGVGPNHTLPTGGTARAWSGLSVSNFLRFQTWLRMDDGGDAGLLSDVVRLAEIEGLSAHAGAARRRLS